MTMHFAYKDIKDMDEETMRKLLTYLQRTNGADIKTNSPYGFLIECDLVVDENFIGNPDFYASIK